MKAFTEYGEAILQIMKNESLTNELYHNVFHHDASKFSVEEFEGYRKFFNPADGESKEDAKIEMGKAWLHHMNENKHHPEYWILRDSEGGKTSRYGSFIYSRNDSGLGCYGISV